MQSSSHEDIGESGKIVLEPFVHQVSGHCPMICVEDLPTPCPEPISQSPLKYDLLCKPLEMQELKFYQTADHSLHPYIPTCYGAVEVDFEITRSDDSKSFVKFSTNKAAFVDLVKTKIKGVLNHHHTDEPLTRSDAVAIVDVSRIDGKIETVAPPSPISPPEILDDKTFDKLLTSDVTLTPSSLPVSASSDKMTLSNPWAQKCLRSFLKRKLARLSSADVQKSVADLTTDIQIRIPYLLLENLVPHGEFRHPSVIDLKLGTRQHSDDCSDAKRDRKVNKAKNTTSSAIGLRLSGMQLYCPTQDRYTYMDKFDGRRLTVDQLDDVVRQFCSPLDNGLRSQMISSLKETHDAVAKLNSYRFYTSSILLAYDCSSSSSSSSTEDGRVAFRPTKLIVKLIDFAHSTNEAMIDYFVQSQKCLVVNNGPDEGLLLGLTNLIDMLDQS